MRGRERREGTLQLEHDTIVLESRLAKLRVTMAREKEKRESRRERGGAFWTGGLEGPLRGDPAAVLRQRRQATLPTQTSSPVVQPVPLEEPQSTLVYDFSPNVQTNSVQTESILSSKVVQRISTSSSSYLDRLVLAKLTRRGSVL